MHHKTKKLKEISLKSKNQSLKNSIESKLNLISKNKTVLK